MNTLPFNILSAIFAPLFVPWIEWTLDRRADSEDLNPMRLRADRVKPNDSEDYTPRPPRPEILYKPQILDEILNPFVKGLPGACIGNIIWGLTFDLENFNPWFFCFYIISLFACVGIVNIIKTKFTQNPVNATIKLLLLALFYFLFTIFRLVISYKH